MSYFRVSIVLCMLQIETTSNLGLIEHLSASHGSSLGHITKDLEHSLDIQSATSGSRIVTAQEVRYSVTL